MSYNYVVTAQKPTAVNGCVTGEAARAGAPGEGGIWGPPRPRAARDPWGGRAGPGPGNGGRRRPRNLLARDSEGAVSARGFGGGSRPLSGSPFVLGGHLTSRTGTGPGGRRASVSRSCGAAGAPRWAPCGRGKGRNLPSVEPGAGGEGCGERSPPPAPPGLVGLEPSGPGAVVYSLERR